VCAHPEREAIDRALVQGSPAPRVAAIYRELSDDAVRRHREAHISARLTSAQDVRSMLEADDLLGQVRMLQRQALGVLAKASDAGDLRTALGAIREARGNLELLAKLLGELNEAPTVNLVVSAQWIEIRALILRALEPHPTARTAVAAALEAHARQ
jgi:hypothetical protein